jgi:hypothetical protein
VEWVAIQGKQGHDNKTMGEHQLQLSRLFEMIVLEDGSELTKEIVMRPTSLCR